MQRRLGFVATNAARRSEWLFEPELAGAAVINAERSMRDYIKGKYDALVTAIEKNKDLSKDDEAKLTEAIKDWKQTGTY